MIKSDVRNYKKLNKMKRGESVLLSGIIYTARDAALKRMYEDNIFPDYLEESIIFHAGPTEKNENGLFSCGPTTAKRMDRFLPFLFEKNLFATIGKGERDIDIHKNLGKIYFLAIGGLGSLYGSRIKSMRPVLYKELKSEALFRMEIENFPVLIGIDSKGKSIFNRRNND